MRRLGGDGIEALPRLEDDHVDPAVALRRQGVQRELCRAGVLSVEHERDRGSFPPPRHDRRAMGVPGMRVRDRGDPGPVEVRRHGRRLQLVDLRLLVAVEGDAPGDPAPLVEDLRDMGDPAGLLGEPQHELEVLDVVERGIEAAERERDRTAHDEEMAHVHHAPEEPRRPVRLEQRVGRAPVPLDVLLVGVDRVQRRVGVQSPDDLGQGRGMELVVVVEHPDELAGRKLERRVRRRGDPGVGRTQRDPDPGIPCGETAQVLVQLGGRGAVVDDHELPVLVRLGQHGCDGGLEDVERRLVGRHQDRDERSVREELGAPDVADPCRPELGLVDDRLVPELGRQGRFAGERQQGDSRRLLRRALALVPPAERREAGSEPADPARRDGALGSALRRSQRGRQPPGRRGVRRFELSARAVAGTFELRVSSRRLPHRPLEQLRARTGLRRLGSEPRRVGAALRDRRLQLRDDLVAPRDLGPDARQLVAVRGVQRRQMLPVEQHARPERRQLRVRGERDQVDRSDRLG